MTTFVDKLAKYKPIESSLPDWTGHPLDTQWTQPDCSRATQANDELILLQQKQSRAIPKANRELSSMLPEYS